MEGIESLSIGTPNNENIPIINKAPLTPKSKKNKNINNNNSALFPEVNNGTALVPFYKPSNMSQQLRNPAWLRSPVPYGFPNPLAMNYAFMLVFVTRGSSTVPSTVKIIL